MPDEVKEEAGPDGASGKEKRPGSRGWRKWLAIGGLGTGALVLSLALVVFVLYQTGTIGSYVEGQFRTALDEMGVDFSSDSFRVEASPLRIVVQNARFNNKKTGQRLGVVRNGTFDLSFLDLFAFSTQRNINVDSADIDGLEVWIEFDKEGRSNFEGVEIVPPQNRVRFKYAAAKVRLRNSVVRFGDESREINGTADDLVVTLDPAEGAGPDGPVKYAFQAESSKIEFSYGEKQVRPVELSAKGFLEESGARIESLVMRSPLGSSIVSGTIDGWNSPKYDLTVSSSIEFGKVSDTFPLGTSISGLGDFKGKIVGDGERYKITGELTSDDLSASDVRLKTLEIDASFDGRGSEYEMGGRAIAKLLTFGEFSLDYPQVTGNIRGTGTDFRWVGALEAAALGSPLGTIGSLYISDAAAEYRDRQLIANLAGTRAKRFTSAEAYLEDITAPQIRVVSSDGVTTAVAPASTVGRLEAEGADLDRVDVDGLEVRVRDGSTEIDSSEVRVRRLETRDSKLENVRASNVAVENRGGRTKISASEISAERTRAGSADVGNVSAQRVTIDSRDGTTYIDAPSMRIASVNAESAVLGELNIAGVRLTVRDGVVRGTTDDFTAGTIDLKDTGRLNDVKAANPVFVLEPSGRYRASLDMTLGSGLLGAFEIGAARASVEADNDLIELKDLTAESMEGRVVGDVAIALSENATSEIDAVFTDIDIAKLVALQTGNVYPLDGKTTGRADFSFAGMDFRTATGIVEAEVTAAAGTVDSDLIPLEGDVMLTAKDGLFSIGRAVLQSDKSSINAIGKFDLARDATNLDISVASSDAGEIERIVRLLNLSPQLEEQLNAYDGRLAGNFTFKGSVTGELSDPVIDGNASLDSIILRGKDLGNLAAVISVSPEGIAITEGLLREQSGGNISFSLAIPRTGQNNTTVAARLSNFNIGNLFAALPVSFLPSTLQDLQAETSGDLDLSGLPNEMRGEATFLALDGTLNGRTFDRLSSKVAFDGTLVDLQSFDARFGQGELSITGTYRTDTTAFDFKADASSIPASRVRAFFPAGNEVPDVEGKVSLKGTFTGISENTRTYELNFEGGGDGVYINSNPVGDLAITGKTADGIFNSSLRVNYGGKTQLVRATADFTKENVPLTASASLSDTRLGPYIGIFRAPGPDRVNVGGTATGGISLAGDLVVTGEDGRNRFSLEDLEGRAEFSKFVLEIDETPLEASNIVTVDFDFNEVRVSDARFSGGGTNLVVRGTKALSDNGVNDLDLVGKINMRVLNAISKNMFFSGIADVTVTLTGSNKNARLNGKSQLESGSVSTFIGTNRVTVGNLKGCILFNTTQIQIGCNDSNNNSDSITGKLGAGQLNVSGVVLLTDSLRLDVMRLKVDGTNVTAPIPQDFSTTGNADLRIEGGRDSRGEFGAFLTGTFYARRSTYTKDIDLADFISSRRETSLAQSGSEDSILENTRLDVIVLGRDALQVRNNLAELTASADLRVTGDLQNPQISGRITANRGTVFFRNDRYELQRGVLTFPPDTRIDPVVNLQAETNIGSYQIFVNLNGKLSEAENLSATVRSNPSLPENDVISLITTGSLADTGTGIPSVAQGGLNTAAEILTDEIINKPITRATDKLFGLNRFNLNPVVSGVSRNPTARLTVGRQINRNLLVTYATNLSQDQNQVVAVEYRVSNRLSFVAQYERRGQNNVTRNRNNLSFEIRLRKRF